MEIHLTEHSKERARERLRWNPETLLKMSKRAMEKGLKNSDASGELKKYLDRLYIEHGNCNNIRIYGEHLYMFGNYNLLTIMQLPLEFRKLINKN